MSRTANTKRNIIFSYIDTIVTLLFQFASRTIIVKVLGEQYLGLSSLFSSVLHVLNMAELGFSGAIVFNMYKPIAENDVDTVCSLLNYYRKIYRYIAIIVFAAGLIVTPFVHYLIKGAYPNNINIYLLFLLYLLNTASSYVFFAYKAALLNALQRLDLSKIAYTIANLVQYSLQIVCLILYKNYYTFVICMIGGTIFKNLLTAHIVNNKFTQYKCKGEISVEVKKSVLDRVKGLLVCNISSVTYTTFDSIIISSFVGLTFVAIYNNYIMVFNGVTTFITMIRTAMQASVGNSVAIESKEKNYNDMLLWQFLFSMIATWCVTCMLCLYQPFMKIWMGDEMFLSLIDVILICIWFYVSAVQHSFFLYLSGKGFWWEMRWPYILSTVTNLVMNIVLGKLLGITGIIFSTVFSNLIFGLIWQCSIVFKCYFKKSMKEFQIKQMFYFAVCVLSCLASFMLTELADIYGIPGLIFKVLICTVVSIVIQFLLLCRTSQFKKTKVFLLNVIHR